MTSPNELKIKCVMYIFQGEDPQSPSHSQRGCNPRKVKHTGWRSKWRTDRCERGTTAWVREGGEPEHRGRISFAQSYFLSLEEFMANHV